MRSSKTSSKVLAALAMSAAASCTASKDGEPHDPPLGRAESALGMDAPSGGNGEWTVVQSADFNFDGMRDVLWNDPVNNLIAVWLMDGARVRAAGPPMKGPPGDGWSAVGDTDFDRDGRADVLFSNAQRNVFAVWLMNGTSLRAPGPEIPGPPGSDWKAIGRIGDSNFDGLPDALFYDSKRNVFTVWLMNGAAVRAPGPELPAPPGDGWICLGSADMNRDGMADVVWQHHTDTLSVWLMNGASVLAQGHPIPAPAGSNELFVAAAGDANFDGLVDLVWNDMKANRIMVWLMNGTSLLAQGPWIPGPAGAGWVVTASGDLNADGMLDIVWEAKNPSRMAVYLMNGVNLLAAGPVIAGPSVP